MNPSRQETHAEVKTDRILILRGGALGDLILTFPLFQSVRAAWPNARIELAAYAPQGRHAVASGLVDSLISLDDAAFASLFSPQADFGCEQTRGLRAFDRVLSLLHDPGGIAEGRLRRSCAGRVVCRSPRVVSGHAADHFLAVAADLGIEAAARYPRLAIQASRTDTGRNVILHPGSGSPRKNWPLEQFVALAERLDKGGIGTPVWLLGEAEEPQRTRLEGMGTRFRLLTGLGILDAARSLAGGLGYVGNDSGVTHLAAALGIPTVAVFGPTDPDTWGPRGPNVAVVRAGAGMTGPLETIGPEAVLEALEGLIRACPPA